MADWVITIPQTVKWEDYQRELDAAADCSQTMSYRLPHRVGVDVGDRCFVVWRGLVRGWMCIVNAGNMPAFKCTTTGVEWPAGFFINRSGPFHPVQGPAMKGFRGIRRFHG